MPSVIVVVFITLSTGTLAVYRLQLAIWTAIALVFAVILVDRTIYGLASIASSTGASKATGAGYLLLTFVDVRYTHA